MAPEFPQWMAKVLSLLNFLRFHMTRFEYKISTSLLECSQWLDNPTQQLRAAVSIKLKRSSYNGEEKFNQHHTEKKTIPHFALWSSYFQESE